MRKWIGILAGLFLLLGAAVLLYYPVSGYLVRRGMQSSIAAFEAACAQAPDKATASDTANEKPYAQLLAAMQRDNESLYRSRQSGLKDAWSYEQAPIDLSGYGISAPVVAVLHIPAMAQTLPVYLGATKENMARGVAILGQSSMPIGGENTNCVIAGHRGYGGVPFLREIQVLQPGDKMTLTTSWGVRHYTVQSTSIIEPDDVEAVLIQASKTMLTLVTCHPYGVGTHRYVVYCTDDGAAPAQESFAPQVHDAAASVRPNNPAAFAQASTFLQRFAPLLAVAPPVPGSAGLVRNQGGGYRARTQEKESMKEESRI